MSLCVTKADGRIHSHLSTRCVTELLWDAATARGAAVAGSSAEPAAVGAVLPLGFPHSRRYGNYDGDDDDVERLARIYV